MNNIVGNFGFISDMFSTMGGWTTQFEVDGVLIGGNAILSKDPRMIWHMEKIGGVKGKKILELGPLEGGHTKMMIEAGAKKVVAIEGLSDCFLRCLIVKEAFNLKNAEFWFADFCKVIPEEFLPHKFDAVLAAGVLYHQKNPAQLIHNLACITDTVMVWSQVASDTQPGGRTAFIQVRDHDNAYYGKWNNYGGSRMISESYCGGLNDEAFWMFPEEMRQCFKDAGFVNIIETPSGPTLHGDCLLFVASK
jgi:hypothetical protein